MSVMAEQSIGALALKIVGPWAWYQAALKNPAAIGKTLPVHENEPQQGYYRVKNRDKGFDPVSIFYPEGSDELVAYRNGREVRPDEIWTWACRSPISYDAYNDAIAGKGWADDDKVVAAQIQPPEPTIGDNSGEVDEADTLKDQIAAALAGMKAYEKVEDDATAAKALSLRNRLNELSNQADKVRSKLKEPFLEGGKAVDAKFQPLVKSAKAGADKVRDAIGAWETVKLQAERKRQRDIEDARIAAEKTAREQQGETAVVDAPAPAAPVDAAPAAIKPTYGKAASVQVNVVVKDVTDWQALFTYMAAREEVQTVLWHLAQKALDAGRTNIPGVVTEERAAVR
jgi:ribosomal protein L16/L10AE